MFDLIRTYQMDIMLLLIASCVTIAVLLLFTDFLSKRSKWIIMLMEITAALLLLFDRMSYLYNGDMSHKGYVLERLSNFFVFFFTSQAVFVFNLLLTEFVREKGGEEHIPKMLIATGIGSAAGMLLAVIAHFTGLYYYFDESNVYHRGPGFLLCYFVPVFIPILQAVVVIRYREKFGRFIYRSSILFIFIPIIVGIIQIFAYGLSIVNMSIAVSSILMYGYIYRDISETVRRAHELEMQAFEEEKKSMKKLFEQTAEAFAASVEKRDPYLKGHSHRVADYAKRIADAAGKTGDESDYIYFTALLNDVGLSGIPVRLMSKREDLTEREVQILQEKPRLSAELLSNIREYPFLEEGARCSGENYDGSGYPEGLKGDMIPEYSRVVAVANAADMMTIQTADRDPLPYVAVREELLTQAGAKYDPEYASLMVQILDTDKDLLERRESSKTEEELICGEYRETVSAGIMIRQRVKRISFECVRSDEKSGPEREEGFSAPSIIVFDSFDRHIYREPGKIALYNYLEYGEFWFDGHFVSTAARNTVAAVTENKEGTDSEAEALREDGESAVYEIEAARFEDHVAIKLISPAHTVDVVMALTDKSKDAFIGLTGENCHIKNITVQDTGETVKQGDIRRIAEDIDFINRMESDLPNIQIDHNRSASTEGIAVEDEMKIDFHTVSLPGSNLVWYCPYIVIFYSGDRIPFGEDYREYALIKFNGECTGDKSYAENRLNVKKNASFPGWDAWKELNREGLECSVELFRSGNTVTVRTQNLGIEIENTTVIRDDRKDIFVSLTGDHVALTDIRI